MKKKVETPIFENCLILEAGEKTALVQTGEEKIVAKTAQKLEKGERVSLFKVAYVPKILEIFIYLIPLFAFAFAFGFGFFFKSSLVHYLVTLGVSLAGILCVFCARLWLKKLPENRFIVRK